MVSLVNILFIKRRFGTRWIDVWTWGELIDNVKSSSNRDLGEHVLRTLPSQVYGLYKSAEVHTIKARIPFKVYLIPLLIVLIVVCVVIAVRTLRSSSSSVLGAQAANGAELAKPEAPASHHPVGVRKWGRSALGDGDSLC